MEKQTIRKILGSILILFTFLSTACSLAGESKEPQTLERGILKVGMNLEKEPMCYLSGETDKPEGFDVELAQAIAGELDLEVEITDVSEENLLKSLDAGIYDCVISAVGLAEWNQAHYGYTRSYADIRSVADEIQGAGPYTELSVFTKKGNLLGAKLDETIEALLENGKIKEISEKYFGQDLSPR